MKKDLTKKQKSVIVIDRIKRFVDNWMLRHPKYTGKINLNFYEGGVTGIKTEEKHELS